MAGSSRSFEKKTSWGGSIFGNIGMSQEEWNKKSEDAYNEYKRITNTAQTGPTLQDYDLDKATNEFMSAFGDLGSGGGGYGGSNIDLSGILSAYDQAAAANKATAKQTYETTRGDLLTSLKRYQEENAKNVENQKRSYLLGQSALESARAEADRQSRIGTSARGLAGSGLQQLAQLQNLISQGQDISNLATENQQTMDALRTALAQRQEDTDTKLANALAVYNNALSSIEAETATNKANIQYQAQEAEANRRASAAAQAASNKLALAQMTAQARDAAAGASSKVAALLENFRKDISGTRSTKKQNQLYSDYKTSLLNLLGEAGLGTGDTISKTSLSNMDTLFDYYKRNRT
jgi:hypothetical protein